MAEWRFYVYELIGDDGLPAYVGKGSGHRLSASRSARGGLQGHEVARFKREKDAYSYEIQRIAEYSPYLNRHPGGNGSYATPKRTPRRDKESMEMERVGSRVYSARMLLRYQWPWTPSELDALRAVANGPRC
jgi:hypothetical protein